MEPRLASGSCVVEDELEAPEPSACLPNTRITVMSPDTELRGSALEQPWASSPTNGKTQS